MRIFLKAALAASLILCFGSDTAPVTPGFTPDGPFHESAVAAYFTSDIPCRDGFLPLIGVVKMDFPYEQEEASSMEPESDPAPVR